MEDGVKQGRFKNIKAKIFLWLIDRYMKIVGITGFSFATWIENADIYVNGAEVSMRGYNHLVVIKHKDTNGWDR